MSKPERRDIRWWCERLECKRRAVDEVFDDDARPVGKFCRFHSVWALDRLDHDRPDEVRIVRVVGRVPASAGTA